MTVDKVAMTAEPVDAPRKSGGQSKLATRIGFRFAFCYWLLYCLPYPFSGLIPWGNYLERPFDWFWHSLVLTGYTHGEKLEVHLHKLDTRNFLLTHRRFHWINEYPFNR